MNNSHEPSAGGQEWSKPSLFWSGTFGCRTPAARRFFWRSTIAVAAPLLWWSLRYWTRDTIPHARMDEVLPFALGAGFAYWAVEFRRYLNSLDELERRIQLESIAWTYLTGLVACMFFGGFLGFAVNPAWVIALEPFRGAYLYFGARRF
jgi:hypothetical protein